MYTRTFRPLTQREQRYVEEQRDASLPAKIEVIQKQTRQVGMRALGQGASVGVAVALVLGGFVHVRPRNPLPLEEALRITLYLLLGLSLLFGMLNRYWTVRNYQDSQKVQEILQAERCARWQKVIDTGIREILQVEADRCWYYEFPRFEGAYFYSVGASEVLCVLEVEGGESSRTPTRIFEMARYFSGDDWEYTALGQKEIATEEIKPERYLKYIPLPLVEEDVYLLDFLEDGAIYPVSLEEIESKLAPYLTETDYLTETEIEKAKKFSR